MAFILTHGQLVCTLDKICIIQNRINLKKRCNIIVIFQVYAATNYPLTAHVMNQICVD